MDDMDSDSGEDEIEELVEDDVEEVVFINDMDAVEEGDGHISEDEEQNNPRSASPVRDDSDFVFTKHSGPVFCCALDPKNGNLAVTGGQDDKAFVWEIDNGQVLFECSGHKDSVTAVSFNFDGTYVATGDMSGLIQVWKVATRNIVWSESVGEFTWLEWHHGTNALLCALSTGELFMWKIPVGDCKVISGHTSMVCGVLMPDGRRVALGYSDGVVKVVELKSGSVQGTIKTGEAHKSVACIDAYSDNNIIATGGEDGVITLLKTQPTKVLWSFNCAHSDDKDPYIESIGFSKDPSLPLLAAGMLGMIYILDFSKQVVRHKCEQESGISRLLWDPHSLTLYVGCLDGVSRVYDGRSGTLQTQLHGHKDTILNIFLSVDGNTLLSVSDDATCRVFLVSPPER